jgi:hypothetical protein
MRQQLASCQVVHFCIASHARGRCKLDNPVASVANSADPPPTLDPLSIASLIFVSSFLATISAAFPLGARMKGTCPLVATTPNKPVATRSISSSISCSVDPGELRIV